jgi:HEAT repeat protein
LTVLPAPDPRTAAPLPSPDCPPELQALIAELTSGDDRRAEASIGCLKPYGSRLLPALAPLLDSRDVDTRWWAVRILAELSDGQAPDLIIAALEDEDVSVRQCAALAITRHGDARAVPGLVQLLSDPDSLLARLAANALVAVGSPAVHPLLELLRDGKPRARFEAVRALALIGDPRAIPALMAVLEEDSTLMEYWADEGLRRMGVGMVYFAPSGA